MFYEDAQLIIDNSFYIQGVKVQLEVTFSNSNVTVKKHPGAFFNYGWAKEMLLCLL